MFDPAAFKASRLHCLVSFGRAGFPRNFKGNDMSKRSWHAFELDFCYLSFHRSAQHLLHLSIVELQLFKSEEL